MLLANTTYRYINIAMWSDDLGALNLTIVPVPVAVRILSLIRIGLVRRLRCTLDDGGGLSRKLASVWHICYIVQTIAGLSTIIPLAPRSQRLFGATLLQIVGVECYDPT
jgi:hypothetical protein